MPSPFLRLAARAAFIGALFLTLLMAAAPDAPRLLHWDKAEHFAGFYLLAYLAMGALPRAQLFAIGVSLSLFAAGVEVVQAIVGRDFSVRDWIASTLGVAAVFAPLALPALRETLGARSEVRRSAPRRKSAF